MATRIGRVFQKGILSPHFNKNFKNITPRYPTKQSGSIVAQAKSINTVDTIFFRSILWSCSILSAFTFNVAGFALGLHIIALIALVSWGAFYKKISLNINYNTLFIISFGACHLCYSVFFSPCQDTLLKSIISTLLFSLMLCIIFIVSNRTQPTNISWDLKVITSIAIASVIIEKIYLVASGASELIRPSGIYGEPSHLALSISPALTTLLISSRRNDRLFGIISLVFLSVFSASATLFFIAGATLIVWTLSTSFGKINPMKFIKYIFTGICAWLIIATSPYKDDLDSRFNGLMLVDELSNVSSLVYINGWQTALENFNITSGFGLGFNRMGCAPRPETAITPLLALQELEELNYNDGSFPFSKTLSELGIFAVIFYALFFIALHSYISKIRKKNCNELLPSLIIAGIVIISVGGFLRGTTYFSGSYIFGLYAIFLSRKPV